MCAPQAVTDTLSCRFDAALEVRKLRCVRDGRLLFGPLSFILAPGEAMAVTGRNGAGKTSLLRLLAGLLRPEAGAVAMTGGTVDASVGEQAHYLGHRDALKPSLSVRENHEFWRAFLADHAGISAESELAAVGLGHAAALPAGYLSAGQRRRLSFARLIAVPRPLWLLDEPLSALDAAGQKLAASLMAAHLARGGIIVAATHGPLGIAARELRIGEE